MKFLFFLIICFRSQELPCVLCRSALVYLLRARVAQISFALSLVSLSFHVHHLPFSLLAEPSQIPHCSLGISLPMLLPPLMSYLLSLWYSMPCLEILWIEAFSLGAFFGNRVIGPECLSVRSRAVGRLATWKGPRSMASRVRNYSVWGTSTEMEYFTCISMICLQAYEWKIIYPSLIFTSSLSCAAWLRELFWKMARSSVYESKPS